MIRHSIYVVVFCFAVMNAHAGSTVDNRELKFGSVAMDIPAVMHKRLTPLIHYLSERLHRPVTLRLSPNMGAAISEAASARVDLSYLTPVAYIEARKQGDVQLIVKTVTNGKGSFQLMIVVREDSDIQSVEQLKGRRFAFGDEKALLQRAAVVGSGIKLADFAGYRFIGHYDNIARAISAGDFDAGILKDTTALKWAQQGLRILYRSPELPPYNVVASRHVDEKTLEQLRQAFLDLDSSQPGHMEIIKSLDRKYDGFAPVMDSEYDVVRELIKPFKK